MSQSHFSSMPSINIPRTGWTMAFNHSTTALHGKVIPIDCQAILPGDSFKLNLSSLIRMSTPIAPIMGTIQVKCYAFFVPQRLVMEQTPEFYGENKESAGPQTVDIQIPAVKYGVDEASTAKVGSVAHYLHKPLAKLVDGSPVYMNSNKAPYVSVLKERAYWLIINEYFRKQQVDAPVLIYTDDTGRIAQTSGGTKTMSSDCWTARKMDDYFTSGSISPQYSLTPVAVPIGDVVPLKVGAQYLLNASLRLDSRNSDFVSQTDTVDALYIDGTTQQSKGLVYAYATGSPDAQKQGEINTINLYADLSKATSANINELRTAFAIQRYLERDTFGTRYPEYLKAHYSVSAPMGLLQRPELLGSASWLINVNQVLSTAGAEASTSTKLGMPGANSTTFNNSFIFRKAFVEHGFLMILLETKHRRLYSQGILRGDLKRTKWEIYSPEFANLGDQSTKHFEVYAQSGVGESTNPAGDSAFNFQEHWAEYRFSPDFTSGLIDNQAPSSLSFWSLGENFGANVAFDSTFLEEDRNAIANCLVSGLTGPDYVMDFHFDYKVVRPMPLYSVPGLIDHVGSR